MIKSPARMTAPSATRPTVPRSRATALGRPFAHRLSSVNYWECNRRSLISVHGLRGSRIVNSLYSPTLLSTVMVPPCCCVTMS